MYCMYVCMLYECGQMVDSDFPQGHTNLTMPSNRISKVVC